MGPDKATANGPLQPTRWRRDRRAASLAMSGSLPVQAPGNSQVPHAIIQAMGPDGSLVDDFFTRMKHPVSQNTGAVRLRG
jgi:hypothetical protein